MDLADTIIDRPHGFSVGNRHFYLYPVTLGKMYLLGRLVEALQINQDIMNINPFVESLRIATKRKDICSRILTYHTIHTKAKIFDNEFVEKRTNWFIKNIDTEALAQAMVMVLTADKTLSFMKYLGFDNEQKRMGRVMKVKKDKNNISFGGLSVYGTLIDAACERYGWTYDYVIWEISYSNLRLLLADKPTSVYISDDEIKKLPASVFAKQNDVIKADYAENQEKIKAMNWR